MKKSMSAKKTKRQNAKQVVDRAMKEEISRREWCIEHASMMENASISNVTEAAEKIYNWTYGAKQEPAK